MVYFQLPWSSAACLVWSAGHLCAMPTTRSNDCCHNLKPTLMLSSAPLGLDVWAEVYPFSALVGITRRERRRRRQSDINSLPGLYGLLLERFVPFFLPLERLP